MRLLALDTTARAGSVALAENGVVIDVRGGDPSRTHGERLPGDVLDLLRAHGIGPADIDIYAIAAGPGSFTGLRVGIACIQGFALVNGRRVVPISALDALAHAAASTAAAAPAAAGALVAAWIDAQRGEVFAALYRGPLLVDGPLVATPARTLDRWRERLADRPVVAIGDGALRYSEALASAFGGRVRMTDPIAPLLARPIAELAHVEASAGRAVDPHAIVPIYIRRPDAEIARIQNPESRIQKKMD
jgi:tRNA threonylcarbamoyladenosine biosynthesis protein TsaB